MWAHFKYENKKEIDLCYEERKKFKEENQRLKHEIKENNETIKKLKKELEKAHREIAEKNKYLSEDKVVIERLSEIKALSDKISNILIDYDKDTIQHLLNEYQK
jgi:replication initiation and membrane attachment protein DnaB